VKGPLLAIDGVSDTDNGSYLCSAVTSAGRFEATSYLKVKSNGDMNDRVKGDMNDRVKGDMNDKVVYDS